MNIFQVSLDPKECAQWHVDRHVIKMIIEYAQLMSTAHRVLDGQLVKTKVDNKEKKTILLPGEAIIFDDKKLVIANAKCCAATHANHPSAIWTRENNKNYEWLYQLWQELLNEWRFRYSHNKTHKLERFAEFLSQPPMKIKNSEHMTPMSLAMGDNFKVSNNPIECYRNYYREGKSHIASWKNRNVPIWFNS